MYFELLEYDTIFKVYNTQVTKYLFFVRIYFIKIVTFCKVHDLDVMLYVFQDLFYIIVFEGLEIHNYLEL
jgi:hypothetical protein